MTTPTRRRGPSGTTDPAGCAGEALVEVLGEAARPLLERHVARSREWFPHRLVPWSEGRTFCAEQSDGSDDALPPGTTSALWIGLLTEDNLPNYFHSLAMVFRPESVMGEWIRRWTAEEQRHATVIRDWVCVTRSLDLVNLERARLRLMSSPFPSAQRGTTVLDALVYLTLQELATRVFHWRTGTLLGGTGQEVLRRVAADENLHYLFYRDLVTAAFDIDPSAVVEAIDRQVRTFEMPGTGIDGFGQHARAIAAAGIYDYRVHHDEVIRPAVITHWRLDALPQLTAAGEAAREAVLANCARLGRIARRIEEQEQVPG
ncbi:MAG: acyl-ACP desaturase [Acidimicrobiales bacterium]